MSIRLRLRCTFAGHPMTISVLEKINGTLWAVEETCECGRRVQQTFPGALVKVQAEAYANYPSEWKEFF